jgi:hypothetical protein
VEGEVKHKKAAGNATTSTEEIPLSAEFRTKLLDFFRPHNKRLFINWLGVGAIGII